MDKAASGDKIQWMPVGPPLCLSEAAFLEYALTAEGIGTKHRGPGGRAARRRPVHTVLVSRDNVERALAIRDLLLNGEVDIPAPSRGSPRKGTFRLLRALTFGVLGLVTGSRIGSSLRGGGSVLVALGVGLGAFLCAFVLEPRSGANGAAREETNGGVSQAQGDK